MHNNFETIQLGTGKEESINGLFIKIKQELEKHKIKVKNPRYNPIRKGEIITNYTDISKARRLINYEPEVKLDKGIKKTVEWFLNQKKNLRTKP